MVIERCGAHLHQRPSGPRRRRGQVADRQIRQRIVTADRRRIRRKHRADRSMVLAMRLDTVLEGPPAAGLLVRVLPAEDRRRRAPALRDHLAPPRARADLRVGHLRRRRLGAHAHRGPGRRASAASSTSSRWHISPASTQPSTSCAASSTDCASADIDNVLALRGDPPDGAGRFVRHRGRSRARQRAHRADHRCVPVLRRRRLLSGEASRVGEHRRGCALRQAQGGRGRELPDHATLLRQQLVLRFRRQSPCGGRDRADHPGDHAGDQRRARSRVSRRRSARPFPNRCCDALRQREADPDAVLQLGVAWATLQCAELLAGGAPGRALLSR